MEIKVRKRKGKGRETIQFANVIFLRPSLNFILFKHLSYIIVISPISVSPSQVEAVLNKRIELTVTTYLILNSVCTRSFQPLGVQDIPCTTTTLLIILYI